MSPHQREKVIFVPAVYTAVPQIFLDGLQTTALSIVQTTCINHVSCRVDFSDYIFFFYTFNQDKSSQVTFLKD